MVLSGRAISCMQQMPFVLTKIIGVIADNRFTFSRLQLFQLYLTLHPQLCVLLLSLFHSLRNWQQLILKKTIPVTSRGGL
jgi:hypothetical protein